MKIAIDGFNLGFAQGTGIATYARELSKILAANNHEIYTCYGLNGVGQNPELVWSHFIQSLTIYGEASRHDVSRWAVYSGRYLLKHLLRQPIQAKTIPVNALIDISALRERLPPAEILNIPSVFRVSQFYSFILNRPLEISFPKDQKVDIFHATCPLPISMKNVANVVTFHDIIPLVLPQSTEVNLRHYQRILKLSIKNADMIFTVSEHSRRDLISYFDIPEDKVYVTYQAVDIPNRYRELDDESVSLFLERNFGLKRNKYFLFFGAVEPKKNIARIIEAMTIAKTDYPIIIVGKDGWLYDDVKRLIAQLHIRSAGKRRFRRIEYLPFRQLMYLLKGACGLVFPSLYEGFGLPVLEAMTMKCPVITSNVSSLPEVGGDAVMYVNPLDVGEIAAAIDRLASDNALRTELIARGLKQAEKFSPANHLQRLEMGYQLAMR
ncbi:MAG: glycosyltransferase family 1 protein [Methylovulum sp.]|uniref:glycosyltransferase family 4 protein n=1 Tax=Methylovulum sp. TaxID=1916980 RepID=UPI00263261FD|nr:glycosyltransferase family 1 protein [Methylovulum sp.]MDD2723473.1 glycosyltransferase family 1 protein [Methylovulum sp.]MDD5123909.1 glycosyltransferase family 1 protein [Methylovulum sp.]